MPTCGAFITTAEQLGGVIGGTLDDDETGMPFCEFDNGEGFGSIQAFQGESAYDQMEEGAIAGFGEENVVITDNTGAASYQIGVVPRVGVRVCVPIRVPSPDEGVLGPPPLARPWRTAWCTS